jgi:hypothetical protein
MNLILDPQKCIITIPGETLLPDVSFGIESVVDYFLGRKVARFDCFRTKLPNGDCRLEFNALKKSGKMAISKIMSVGNAVSQGYFPQYILDSECFLNEPGFQSSVEDGQHRHIGMVSKSLHSGQTVSIIETPDIRPDIPLCHLSYGLSDMFTGLFALGVKYVKWQASIQKTQLYVRHNLTDEQLKKYLTSSQDYDLTQMAKELR